MLLLSGNHREDAARAAGVQCILVLYTHATLSRSNRDCGAAGAQRHVDADNKPTLPRAAHGGNCGNP